MIAHPASGMGEAWKIYCLERQDNVEELKPEGSRSNEPLVLRNQQLRASPFMDGTVLGVIGEAKQDCRVQLFPRGLSPEDKRLVEESKTSQLKPTVIGSSTPKGVLSAGSSVFRSPGSSTSSTASYSGVNGQLQSNIVPAVVPRRASGITPRRLDTSYTE